MLHQIIDLKFELSQAREDEEQEDLSNQYINYQKFLNQS